MESGQILSIIVFIFISGAFAAREGSQYNARRTF